MIEILEQYWRAFLWTDGRAFSGLAVTLWLLVVSVGVGFVLSIILTVIPFWGFGSVWAALVAALVIGFADTFGKVLVPELSGMVVYLVMAGVLLWGARGIFKKG